MWGAAIIVFREVFEIAIIMCVVLAATRQIPNKAKWIWIGIFSGMLGAVVFAGLTEWIAKIAGDAGKLYFNAGILFVAVIMIGWTVVWMKQHGRAIVSDMKQMSRSVATGEKPLHILAIIIGLAVLREGSEIVVFIYGLIAADEITWTTGLLGSLIGLGLGTAFGLCMYYGLLRLSVKYLFQIPSILLTLIAGGMAANAAGKLVHAGLIPALVQSMWNTASILPQHSILGRFLAILIGYQENPDGMQVAFYLVTVGIIVMFAKKLTPKKAPILKHAQAA